MRKLEILVARYPHEVNKELAKELGCTTKAMAYRAHQMGLKKTDAARQASWGSPSSNIPGERRPIATGILVTNGRVLTHLSNASAARG